MKKMRPNRHTKKEIPIVITKYKNNPIIKPSDVIPSLKGYKVLGAFNPGATVFGDEILLLLRVAEGCEPQEGVVRTPIYHFDGEKSYPSIMEFKTDDPNVQLKDTRGVVYKGKDFLSTASHIRIARSKDGLNFTVDKDPFLYPVHEREKYGCEDVRITKIDGRYYLNFTVISEDSWSTMLAVTDDFRTVERKGIIFHPENKDVAIFPERIGGKYIALHRPNNSGFGKAAIWYAESPDLLHWGNHRSLVHGRDMVYENIKIGGGAPPIKTDQGWLIIYHGKGEVGYSLFCLLLDLEDPTKIVKRAEEPLITPTEKYELEGFFGKVVFSNGVAEKDGKLFVYYGASDETSCVLITDIDSLLASF